MKSYLPDDYEAVVFHDNNCLSQSVETYDDVERFVELRFQDDLSRYHIYVNQDGSVSMGDSIQDGSKYDDEFNGKVISVYVVGDFVTSEMGDNQKQSLIDLCTRIRGRFHIDCKKWVRHSFIEPSKTCPGKHFPLDEIMNVVGNWSNSEYNQKPIETLQDTCDVIRDLSNRFEDHADKFQEAYDLLDDVSVA
jgi:hypothetical protein